MKKTSVKRNAKSPEWNEQFKFAITTGEELITLKIITTHKQINQQAST